MYVQGWEQDVEKKWKEKTGERIIQATRKAN